MKKLVIFFTIMCVAVNIFCGSVAFASEPTSWADVDEEAQDVYSLYIQYAYWLMSGVDISTEEALEYWDASIINSLEWCEAFGWYVCPYDNIYYYIYDGELWCYEGDFADACSGAGGRCRRAGGGRGQVRGKVSVSGDTFNDMIAKVNSYYMPSANTDTKIASIQNPSHTFYGVDGYGWAYRSTFKNNHRALIPLRLGSDLLFGDDVSEYWLYPFIYNDDNGKPYYGQYQIRLYHKLVTAEDGTTNVCIYADYYDMLDGNNVLDVLVTDDVAMYPYIILIMYQGATNIAGVYGFANYTNFLQLKTFPSLGSLSASDINTGSVYSTDLIENTTGYDEILSDTFIPIDDGDDDVGFYVSSEQFDSVFKKDWQDLPSDYIVTYQGDNFYDYSITNSYGDTTTIYNYITNNYYFPDDDDDDDGGDTTINNNWDISFGDFIANIETSITNSITTTFNLMFVPSDTYFSDLSSDFDLAIDAKLPFINDFPDLFNSFFVEIKEDNKLYTQAASGDYSEPVDYPKWSATIDWHDNHFEIVILDFSVFAEVLPVVRVIVVAFLYLFYFWRLFKYLPTLIGNVGDMVNLSIPTKGG